MMDKYCIESAKIPYETPSIFAASNSSVIEAHKRLPHEHDCFKRRLEMNSNNMPSTLSFFLLSIFRKMSGFADMFVSEVRKASWKSYSNEQHWIRNK